MSIAVICEFNPFHNGHKYFLEQVKSRTDEPVIAIMSGSFVQRGEIALQSKFERAETALQNGADLVAELPTVFAVANAQRFAKCGVEIAKAFPSVTHLAFGCETDNEALLSLAVTAVDDESVGKLVTENMKLGMSYPNALQRSVEEVFGSEVAEVISTPNNILAVEYLREMKNTDIKPLPIKRKGTDHDSERVRSGFASASQIRQMIRNNADVSGFLPRVPNEITYPENLERAMLYKLRTMSVEDFAELPDVKEGLENRIYNAVHSCGSIEDILMTAKTKRYTLARLRRILTCAFLAITEDLQTKECSYVRALGFNRKGSELLKGCRLEVVTSVAKAIKEGGDLAEHLRVDVRAGDVFGLGLNKISKCGQDFSHQIIKIENSYD